MPTREEVLAQQKEQCPFCKIIAGEIPAHKIFENQDVLAILDINPAAPGHVLLMPKEHYPIMQMVPAPIINNMLECMRYIMRGQLKGVPSESIDIFIANGAAAGQRATHFMIHLIPKKMPDGRVVELSQDQIASLKEVFNQHFNGVQADQRKALAQLLEENKEIRQRLVDDPEAFKRQIQENPELSALFNGVDLHALADKLKDYD